MSRGEKITLEQCLEWRDLDALEAGLVACPKKGCEGVVVIKESRHWQGQYLGCSNSDKCNYYTTAHKLLGKTKKHPQCPYCQCPVIPKTQNNE